MSKIILCGLNEQSEILIKEEKIDIIFDKFFKGSNYQNIAVCNDINMLSDEIYSLCVISSTTYFFDIKKEVQSINKNIKVVHINALLNKYPKTFFIENINELQKCEMINSCIEGKLFINKGLIIQLFHDIPVSINVDKNAELYLDDNVLMDGVEISARGNSKVSLGNKTYINKFGVIRSRNLVEIGSQCAIAWNVTIMDNDGYFLSEKKDTDASVIIKSNVWIGNNVNILKNTKINHGCVVGSMSKVKGEFEKNCLIAGNPAKKVKENVKWK